MSEHPCCLSTSALTSITNQLQSRAPRRRHCQASSSDPTLTSHRGIATHQLLAFNIRLHVYALRTCQCHPRSKIGSLRCHIAILKTTQHFCCCHGQTSISFWSVSLVVSLEHPLVSIVAQHFHDIKVREVKNIP